MNHPDTEQRLREYYQSELAYLRKSGVEFARQYPGIAGRLELGADSTPDPFTERLIESFAWLTGRIRHSISARIPQVSATLLGALYPNFTAPVPPMSIAELTPDSRRPELTEGVIVPQGTPLECTWTKQGGEEIPIKWRTAWPVTLYPIRVFQVDFQPAGRYGFHKALSVLRIRLQCEMESFEQCDIKTLRFFLFGDRFETFAVYEKVLMHQLGLGLVNPDGEDDTKTILLDRENIQAAGLTPEEFVLPGERYTIPAYQLVQEYFAFPERFLYFDFPIDLQKHVSKLAKDGSMKRLDVLIPLETASTGLSVSSDMFRLYTTPIVNLFEKISEPLDLDEMRSEYRLLPDARRNASTEIHTVDSVSMIDPENGDTLAVEPFFSPRFEEKTNKPKSFWIMERTPSAAGLPGTDVWLRFVDSVFNPTRVESRTVFAKLLCTNRFLAAEIAAGTRLLSEREIPTTAVSLLMKPTVPQAPPMDGESLWMLISHLSLNYLSLEGENAAAVLREILRLYIPRESTALMRQLQGVRNLETKPIVRRMGTTPWRGFVRGLGIELTLDDACFPGGSPYLFAEVMNSFFRLYAGINTPTQLSWKRTVGNEIRKQWKPNFGMRPGL